MNSVVITNGTKEKYDSFAYNFVKTRGAQVLTMLEKPKRLDRVLKLIGLGAYYANDKYIFKSIDGLINPELFIVIKGTAIRPRTIVKIKNSFPKAKLVLWTPDDLSLKHNSTKWFRKGLRFYDLLVTAKEINVIKGEFNKLGVKKVVFLHQAYDEFLHDSKQISSSPRSDYFTFVGMYEPIRYEYLKYIASKGIPVRVYGNGWPSHTRKKYPNLLVTGKPVIGLEYVRVLGNSLGSICFLRKINRDQHTTRTFEIPACGGLMIAERTSEHERYYEEDKEVLYFSSKDEFFEKLLWIRNNPERAEEIRMNGINRTLESKYSYRDLIDKIMCILKDE